MTSPDLLFWIIQTVGVSGVAVLLGLQLYLDHPGRIRRAVRREGGRARV